MTNEQLVMLIKQSSDNKMIYKLWERLRVLIYSKASLYYDAHIDRFKEAGIEKDDLKQEFFFAFLKAVHDFDPDKKYCFTTYLELPIKQTVHRILCSKKDPLNTAASIDSPIKNKTDISLSETLPCENEDAHETALNRIRIEKLLKSIDKLSEMQKTVVRLYYFDDLTDKEISKRIGCSPSSVKQARRSGLINLRKMNI